MIFNNPLIRRYRYSLLRPRQFWISVTIYISIIALILFINYTAYQYRELFRTQPFFLKGVYYQFVILQLIVLCILGAINSSSAIKDEVTGKTYDFFRMLPVSAGKKAVGVLVGKNLVVLLMAAVNFILLIILGKLGKLDNTLLGHYFLALISLAVFTNSIALLSSIKPVSAKKKTHIITFIILGFIFAPFLLSIFGVAARKINVLETVTAKFYTIEFPLLVLISLIALYFSCWSIKGILRRFTREDEPLFTRASAFLFMIGFEVVLFGLFYTYLKDEASYTYIKEGARWANYWFWLISLLPVLLVPVWACRSYEKYIEQSGLIQSRSAEKVNIISKMLLYFNLSHEFGLFVIWVVGSTITSLLTGQEMLESVYNIIVLFSFFLFLMLLLELHVVYKPVSSKMGLLLLFITIVYLILPLIISGILRNDMVYTYSLFGFSYSLLAFRADPTTTPRIYICLINVGLCIIPVILIWTRYKNILTARSKM